MKFFGLKAKFIVVVALLALGAGLLTLWAFAGVTGRVIDAFALRYAVKEAQLQRHKLRAVVERDLTLARKMAADPLLVAWAGDESDPRLAAAARDQLESYRRLYRDAGFFFAAARTRRYYVSDPAAPQRTVAETLSPDQPADRWFFESLATVRDYALNLDYNRTLHETRIWINVVMRAADGSPLGICGSGLNLTSFLDEIVRRNEAGVATILIDRDGVIQAHADRSIVEHNAGERDRGRKRTVFDLFDGSRERVALAAALQRLQGGESEIETLTARSRGVSHLLAVTPLPEVGWFNVVQVDSARVIRFADFLPVAAVLVGSLLTLIAALGLLLNRMVLAPLYRLTAASREVAAGRYAVALPPPRNDEIGILTESFATMATTILDHTRTLEERVRERTAELAASNADLAASRQRIDESIRYARQIQTAILPTPAALERALGEVGILYRPKEVVGGDFYYLRESPGSVLLACIDCTGHGVPGAFVTMTVHAVLNHVLDTAAHDDPARILAELDAALRRTLRLRGIDAGLDIGLCRVGEGGELVFAGAGLSLWHLRAGAVAEIRGDRRRLGYQGDAAGHDFAGHRLQLAAGDLCALASDGLLDEPGGEKGFAFGSDRCRTLLAECGGLPAAEVCRRFDERLAAYRGGRPQRDDLTLIVFRHPTTPRRNS